MAEVTYYVALPFVAADDGVAAGEAVECFNPNAVVMRAFRESRAFSAPSPFPERVTRPPVTSATLP